jgi:tryptophan synthase alpha chain
VAVSTGFLYYVSLTGVTGARRHLPEDVTGSVRAIRRMTKLPVCVGFGISSPAQVREILKVADGVVVGSALLDAIAKAGPRAPQAAEKFLKELKNACR